MKLLVITQVILLHGFSEVVFGNGVKHRSSFDEKGSELEDKNSDKNHSQLLPSENSKNLSNSVTYISTYTSPSLIWSSHHAKKLREKMRKNKIFNRVQSTMISSETKILPKLKNNVDEFVDPSKNLVEFDDWKDFHTKEIQLPIEKMFIDTNFVKKGQSRTSSKYENATNTAVVITDLGVIYDNALKMLKKKKKRKNRKSFKALSQSQSLENFNVSTNQNTSNALSTIKNYSTEVGESRTFSLILFMNAIFVPAIILQILTIGAFIFVSPVVGFGLLLVTFVGSFFTGILILFLL